MAASASTTAGSVVLDAHQRDRVSRLVRIRRDDRGDRLADVARFTDGERALRTWRVQADVGVRPIRTRRGQRVGQLGKVIGEKDRHARNLSRPCHIDREQPRPRMRRAHEGEVKRARPNDVVDEASAPGDEALVFLASG